MKDILTEALIEMHFHSALIDYFTAKHGMRKLKLIVNLHNKSDLLLHSKIAA